MSNAIGPHGHLDPALPVDVAAPTVVEANAGTGTNAYRNKLRRYMMSLRPVFEAATNVDPRMGEVLAMNCIIRILRSAGPDGLANDMLHALEKLRLQPKPPKVWDGKPDSDEAWARKIIESIAMTACEMAAVAADDAKVAVKAPRELARLLSERLDTKLTVGMAAAAEEFCSHMRAAASRAAGPRDNKDFFAAFKAPSRLAALTTSLHTEGTWKSQAEEIARAGVHVVADGRSHMNFFENLNNVAARQDAVLRHGQAQTRDNLYAKLKYKTDESS